MIKKFSMFSGYGGGEFALDKANIDYEVVGYSEIDKSAIQCYCKNHYHLREDGLKAVHTNFGDCTDINPKELPYFDLLTGGFPCQPFSVSGKGLGELDIRGTLFNDIVRIAEERKPKYILLENVKGLAGKKHEETLKKIQSELKRIGYYVYIQILDSKEFGIPQSRKRLFFVCFRDKVDFDCFVFPKKEELDIFVEDILEKEVDDKYYLKANHLKRLMESEDVKKRFSVINPKVAITQTARQYDNWKGNYIQDEKGIRKLTPRECFRLMGFLNNEIDLEGISDRQAYKLAGNGWEINLISKIFKEMFRNVN